MKIIGYCSENIKILKAVEITPQGNVIILSGKNGQGKSTILDSIWWALGGAKDIQDEPIRKGADKGKIQLDLGDLLVTRKFTKKSTTLEVTNKDGLVFKSPQAVLDKLIGQFTFDVTRFLQAEKKEQVNTLLDMVNMQADVKHLQEISGVKVPVSNNPLDMLNSAYGAVFEERKDINRDLDRVKKSLETMPAVEPTVPVSITDLVAEKEKLEAENRENVTKRQRFLQYGDRVDLFKKEIEKNQTEIDTLKDRLKRIEEHRTALSNDCTAAQAALEEYKQQLAELSDNDLTDINARIASADDTNRKAQAYAAREEKSKQKNTLTSEAQALTKKLEAIREYKEQLVADAKFPIDGLNFAGGGVTYKGIPFEQASSAEQLQISVAIAMALNPTLRVIRIDNASIFDSEHLAIIEQMAQENDYQVWMEVVDESGKVGIVIEDGQVKGEIA